MFGKTMTFAYKHHLRTLQHILLSLALAIGFWYAVVGSEQVEAQVEVRLDYRGLATGIVIRDGQIPKVNIRLRGPAELVRSLHSRELAYTVDLSTLVKGANVITLPLEKLNELKAYEVLEVNPARLVLEVDAVLTRQIPLEPALTPLPEKSAYKVKNVQLVPTSVEVTGAEALVKNIASLKVSHDPTQNTAMGPHVVNLAIMTPAHVAVSPPVAVLRYTLDIKAQEVKLDRLVQVESTEAARYSISPKRVNLTLEVPEGRINSQEYLAAIRVVVRPPSRLSLLPAPTTAESSLMVVLPAGSRLIAIEPATIKITRER